MEQIQLTPVLLQVLWKSYIDFEIEQEEYGHTRSLYRRLLQRTQHVKVRSPPSSGDLHQASTLRASAKPPLHPPPPRPLQVWISYAKFELSVDDGDRLQKSRQIYEEANKSMRSCEEKEERLMLLESWRDFERDFGSEATVEKVRRLMPKKVKKRRKLTAEDGVRTRFLCRSLPVWRRSLPVWITSCLDHFLQTQSQTQNLDQCKLLEFRVLLLFSPIPSNSLDSDDAGDAGH